MGVELEQPMLEKQGAGVALQWGRGRCHERAVQETRGGRGALALVLVWRWCWCW